MLACTYRPSTRLPLHFQNKECNLQQLFAEEYSKPSYYAINSFREIIA